MILLVSGATATVPQFQDVAGILVVPSAGNHPDSLLLEHRRWAIDNEAFSGFDPVRFLETLYRFQPKDGCLFVVAPDVVADSMETMRLFKRWEPIIHGLGYPVAFVGQDGMALSQVPWSHLEALFIGGSTEWKLGIPARTMAAYALARGKWLHMGRVNSRRRIRYAQAIGCDSIDGSGFSRWSRIRLPLAERWIREGSCRLPF